ncbi:metal ABC transporter solute-binding protein, Zn/Mn family [Allochromatium vinosum]|uniref:High-affinity zinc uptake system protein ZnuA n=1 Tax=Allochromatium vinosum (strain ATCC 17899 / DSM 180 / NBRC 103801 / NCIMB 10441 / D) TaxID=572477 RepID=D3RMP6_ALLVD|nr:zinc ABC transporter substrate-binding protein [Allochromatium vinosum]ADC63184.1 periplasmic solute binding protein [Allochromatium vinosum DSM 180]
MRTRILSFIALLCLSTALPGADRIQVFVTVPPQQTFVEQIGGSHVQVEALVGAGSNPHAYEPPPGQIARLAEADVYFGIGLPMETAWMKRIRAVNPEIRVVDLSDGISRRRLEAHEHGHGAEPDHHHESDSEQDPHIWTSPPLVIGMAERIAGTLSELDPERAAEYEARRADFIAELKALDADTRARLDRLTHRRFMVYHPSWGYFAETYGLTQIPIEAEGKEPGPRRLAALIDQARREDVRVILAQPQLSTKAAEQVAREIGGRVEVVDTLAADYIGTIRHLTRVLTSADE